MPNKNIRITVRVSAQEFETISKKSKAVHKSVSTYMRTASLDDKVYFLESPEHREVITEMHRIGANINQIARRLNETGSLYFADMEDIRKEHDDLCRILSQYLSTLHLKEL